MEASDILENLACRYGDDFIVDCVLNFFDDDVLCELNCYIYNELEKMAHE